MWPELVPHVLVVQVDEPGGAAGGVAGAVVLGVAHGAQKAPLLLLGRAQGVLARVQGLRLDLGGAVAPPGKGEVPLEGRGNKRIVIRYWHFYNPEDEEKKS